MMENMQRVVVCVCGTLHAYDRPCTHDDAEPYSTRFRTASGDDGVEEGILGPEGNRIPLTRRVFEEEGIQHYWVDTRGQSHPQPFEPYKDLSEYTEEDFTD